MRVISAESTELFVGPPDAPLQLVRVTYTGASEPTPIRVDGDGLAGEALADTSSGALEIPVLVERPEVGQQRDARLHAGNASAPFVFTVAEPGWTMHMVSHFHYDPVWWNTQAAYTSEWREDPPGDCRQTNAFELIRAHLDAARCEPQYTFVLAEADYLKPYWDAHPEDRAALRRLIAEGRLELTGGTYNEPNTVLTDAETTIRNFVYGMGFLRDVVGADPATAWQLDVFGHDPQFPGMVADAGLTSSAWARGPHHQWGPMQGGDLRRMQFGSEFEWIAPSGLGLLTHYMPAHYSAGWWMNRCSTLEDAERETYRLFEELKKVASTRNVLLPVGTDYTPPNRWVTEIAGHWNSRYTWPRFVCALPKDFFAAVRGDLDARGVKPSPQTRDMNPIYTGTYVSYIDTKQANRAAENTLLEAERFSVFASLLTGAAYPDAALDKAWRQLVFGAHHDGITGSESDQVYLDLLTGWRDAWDLARAARDESLTVLSRAVTADAPAVVVWNPSARKRTDIVTARLEASFGNGVRVLDDDGMEVPALVEHGGRSVSWLARDVPSLGWRAYRLTTGGGSMGWDPTGGTEIANENYRLRVDPARGGGVSSLVDLVEGRELIADGAVGNELAAYEEYPQHPNASEGPWHLLPTGRDVVTSSDSAAESLQAYRSAVGQRLVIRGRIAGLLSYLQTVTLWHGVPRVDCRTDIHEFTGADRLLRLRWPCPVPGAVPVSEVGDAVIGRGFAFLYDRDGLPADSGPHPWTLDNAAHGWFGLSSAARIRVGSNMRTVSVAEVVTPTEALSAPLARDLVVALVHAGVTATCSGADKPRYGDLDVDSNLPDVRIALGGPNHNAFTRGVLSDADPVYGEELERQLQSAGHARVWVPATSGGLPVLVIAGRDAGTLDHAVVALADDLADAEVVVDQKAPAGLGPSESRTVAVLNRGTPGFAVDPGGTLHMSLMRSCTGWPSGMWIDPPQRATPDGSSFQLQHWSHSFDYALVSGSGDWRYADVPARSDEFTHPLLAVVSTNGSGRLPAAGSLLEVDSPSARLAALKAAGNPLARGSSRRVDPHDGVALRLVETRGTNTAAVIRSSVGRISQPVRANLLEEPRDAIDGPSVNLSPYQIATVLSRIDAPRVLDTDGVAPAPVAEPAQPLYARYWLHNRGPAALGGLPAVAHLHPQRAHAEPGTDVALRLTVSSDCVDARLRGEVRLRCPSGWSAVPEAQAFDLPAGRYVESDVVVTAPATAAPGLYPVRAQLELTGSDLRAADLPAAWRQVVEDVCVVTVGDRQDRLLRLISGPDDVTVARGDTARLDITVGTDARADVAVEANLVSPWGTWDWVGPAAVGAVVPAGGTVDLTFTIAPPAWVEPGQWWAIVRVAGAGRLVYSPTVKVMVR